MRTYHATEDGEIVSRAAGEPEQIVVRRHRDVSDQHLAEILQHVYDAGCQDILRDVLENVGNMLNGFPDALRSGVRSNVRPDTDEVWNKR